MGRHIEERLALLSPRLTRASVRMLLRLPPGSTVRRRTLKRAARLAWEATARRDYDATLILFERDYEIHLHGMAFGSVGFEPCYRGHEGMRQFNEIWRGSWGEIEYTIVRLYDLGDRVISHVRHDARGLSSGAEASNEFGAIYHLPRDLIVRQDVYWEWADCARAAGISG
jgi:ketosteroid isomerase-like protein